MNPHEDDLLPDRHRDVRADEPGGAEADAALAIDETDRLIASDKVAGTSVYGRDGERLGAIYNFMVDKVSGRVAYVVMSFGGFLGLGERFYPLPWKALTYVPSQSGYVVGLSRQEIEAAPSYAAGEQPWADPGYDKNVYGYYGFEYGL